MLPVEILQSNGSVVLRARSSELLILPCHVRELKGKEQARDFSAYFTSKALVNRAARKLFEGWLRKDRTVWPRLYRVIHKEVDMEEVKEAETALSDRKNKTSPATSQSVDSKEKDENTKEAKVKGADTSAHKIKTESSDPTPTDRDKQQTTAKKTPNEDSMKEKVAPVNASEKKTAKKTTEKETIKKASEKKAPAKKATAKKATAKKATAKKATAKKTTAKKTTAKKTTAKKTETKAPTKKK